MAMASNLIASFLHFMWSTKSSLRQFFEVKRIKLPICCHRKFAKCLPYSRAMPSASLKVGSIAGSPTESVCVCKKRRCILYPLGECSSTPAALFVNAYMRS